MIIQFDTAHNVYANEKLKAPLIELLTEKLHRFRDQITRLEVHLSDENGNKEGPTDKHCLLEAHCDGMPHVVVKNNAGSYTDAVDGAIDKLISSLHSTLERLGEHRKQGAKQLDAE